MTTAAYRTHTRKGAHLLPTGPLDGLPSTRRRLCSFLPEFIHIRFLLPREMYGPSAIRTEACEEVVCRVPRCEGLTRVDRPLRLSARKAVFERGVAACSTRPVDERARASGRADQPILFADFGLVPGLGRLEISHSYVVVAAVMMVKTEVTGLVRLYGQVKPMYHGSRCPLYGKCRSRSARIRWSRRR